MCLAMNPDKLVGDQLCASSSNRNFKGRQGSPTGHHAHEPHHGSSCGRDWRSSDARKVLVSPLRESRNYFFFLKSYSKF